MYEETFEVSGAPRIELVQCGADLTVRGVPGQRVAVRMSKQEALEFSRDGETFTIRALEDCSITCPSSSSVAIGSVGGSLRIEDIGASLAIETVTGNLKLQDVGEASIKQVYGNVRARRVGGRLRLQRALGNVKICEAEDALSMAHIGGNLLVRDSRANVQAEWVGGNVSLQPSISAGQRIAVKAGGNVTIRLPAEAGLRATLRAGGGVRSRISGLTLEKQDGKTLALLGSGDSELEVEAGGYVSLRLQESAEDMAEWSYFVMSDELDELRAEIESSIAQSLAQIETRLEGTLAGISDEEVQERIRLAEAKAMDATRAAYEKVRRQAEREAERARLRAERAERRWQRVSGKRQPQRERKVTDEERMRVLRLVEEGKITPDQATDLLAALEGR